MQDRELLTSNNYFLYCAHHYDNPSCRDTAEFQEDLRRIKYIKKLVTKYIESGDLKERLILNHLIVLGNVFAPVPLCRILFLKMEEYLKYIKPFLIHMNVWQENLFNIKREGKIDTSLIPMDELIIKRLREL
jgi:hypothetical protein